MQGDNHKYVGADPRLIPHFLWLEWERDLLKYHFTLVKVHRNLVNMVWDTDRPQPRDFPIRVHSTEYAGEKWESKVAALRETLPAAMVDAMVVTSLTEIAYLLNLRGSDIPYIPVFKAFLIVTPRELVLYTDLNKVTLGVKLHLKSEPCFSENCVQ